LNPSNLKNIERWEYHTEVIPLNIKVIGVGWAIQGGMSINQSDEHHINKLIDSRVEVLGKEGWLPEEPYNFNALSRAGFLKFKDIRSFMKWGSGCDYLLESISFKLRRPIK